MKLSILSWLLSCLAVVLASVCVQAQQPDYSFINLNASNSALSFNKVHVITQDAKGFIWMGTADGLNRYDGRNFKTFGVEELGTESAFVVSLCADDKGNLWVGTDTGITCYNYEMDSFTPLSFLSDKGTSVANKVSKIAIDREGTVWFSVLHQGLFSYDGVSLKNYFYENGEVTLPSGVRAFLKDNNGVFWLSLYFDDLYWSDDDLQSIHRAEIGTDGKFFSGDDIMSICRNPVSNTLFIASNNRGLCEVDSRTRSAKVLIPNDKGFIVEAMNCDRNQRVWLSTTNGLYCYDIAAGKAAHYTFDADNPYGVSENHIFDAYTDNSGGLWVATYSKGVDYSGSSQLLFDKLYSTSDGKALSGALMRSMATDNAGNIWVASEEKGLYVYSRADAALRRYRSRVLPDNLFGIFHEEGRLWIGSLQGIYRLDIASGNIRLYSSSDHSADFKDSKIYTIFKSSDGGLYFGTTLGLFKYDRNSDSFHAVKDFEGVFVVDIIEDIKGNLWLASYADGIFRYSPETGEVDNYRKRSKGKSIPCDKIMSLFEDSSGRIWAASFGAGFFTLDDSLGGGSFNQTSLDGLPSNVFYKILEDNEGCLWLSSDKGLVAFNPSTGQLRSFTESDGLLDNDFNYNSAIKLPDGRMMFGSTNGMVLFNPSVMVVKSDLPDIVITDFTVNSKSVKPDKKDSYLERHVNETEKIILAPDDNSFGFSVSLLGSGLAAGNAADCMLVGYDDDWRKSTSDMKFSWENVPAGRYTLCVRGQEGGEHAPIEIVVRQKFYKSSFAIILYVLVVLMCAAGFIMWFWRRTTIKAEKTRKEYERVKEEELFRDKLSFFANVIHEIKTPLTLIKTPLQNIMSVDKVTPDIKDDLAVITRSTDYLDQLVRELLDFIRLERHGYVLEYKTVDLIEKINFLCFNFSDTARTKNIRLDFRHNEEQLLINADSAGLVKILNNLIHNAVKYSETYIDINAERVGDKVIVRFTNDGPVIPQSRRNDIFKPFVRFDSSADSYAQSFGIGLSLARNLAELHDGNLEIEETELTCFVLTLPLKSEMPQADMPVDAAPEIYGNDENHPLLMIVEDNADLLEYLRTKLCDGYRVLTSQSAERALNLLKKYAVDIIVSDISLPGMSGVDLCARINSDFATSHIPVIILSAISDNDTKLLCVQNGASMYIEKPFSMDYLKACLKAESRKNLSTRRTKAADMNLSAENITVPGSDKDFLENLDKVIFDNISDTGFSNDQIADALFISKTTLIRKVKGLLGTTPNDYLRQQRLALAAKMLLKEGCRISDVCYSVGFNTPSYFTKCFKKEFGVLPAEYIKQHKNNN